MDLESAPVSRHYSLDSIILRGQRVFGWGFCLDTEHPLKVRSLRVPIEGGGFHDLEVWSSGGRADLIEAFPTAAHAGASGFMVHGRLPTLAVRGVASLVLEPSGELLPLAGFPEAYIPATDLNVQRGSERLLGIVRQRGWGGALKAAIRGIGRRMALSLQPATASMAEVAKGATVMFDHGMGGGASRYSKERIARMIGQGIPVLRVYSELSSLSYRVQLVAPRAAAPTEVRLESMDQVLDLVTMLKSPAIEINSLVGFDDVIGVLDRLTTIKTQHPNLRLRFNLHDFHALCPSFTLIDASGRHCAVPVLDVCRTCLPVNSRFSLGMNANIEIAAWRSAWARFLAVTDERVAFSRSSIELFAHGIAASSVGDWRIEPHTVNHEGFRQVLPKLDEPLHVVAVGHLNHAKGAGLISDLARRASERELPLRFTVLGTLEGGDNHPSIRIIGAFERERLCALLEAEGTGIALLPSICPETYSYVTDELMATGLPLAVLDLGAPAERVAGYHSGLLLPTEGLDAQLDALVAFARRLGAFS